MHPLEKILATDHLLLARTVNDADIMTFLDVKGLLLKIAKGRTACAFINNSRYIHDHPKSFNEDNSKKQRRP